MAECDRCLAWLHYACEGITQEEMDGCDSYICVRCRQEMAASREGGGAAPGGAPRHAL
jgi:hypothetical protein